MKSFLLLIFLFLLSTISEAQVKKVRWQDVEVRELVTSDSLSIGKPCAEWFVEGEADALSNVFPNELKAIKKKAAKFGCNIAYVDVRKIYGPMKGRLYVLGVKTN